MDKKHPEQVKSIRALAVLVGKSASAVRKWTKDPRWCYSQYGPWTMRQVQLIRAWAESNLKHDQAQDYHKRIIDQPTGVSRPPTKMEQAKLAYMVERAMWVKQKRLTEAGDLHSVKECQQRRVRQIHEVKSRLLELPRSMANTLAMQGAETVERLLMEQILALLDDFSGETKVDGSDANDK